MRKHGIATDDLFSFITPHLGDVQPPGDVHFTAAGYELLGGQVAKAVLDALRGSRP
jgi:lysophospholipase L1-like esterase